MSLIEFLKFTMSFLLEAGMTDETVRMPNPGQIQIALVNFLG
jgi:hypothetical protein